MNWWVMIPMLFVTLFVGGILISAIVTVVIDYAADFIKKIPPRDGLAREERKSHAAVEDAYKTAVHDMNIAADQEWRNWRYQ